MKSRKSINSKESYVDAVVIGGGLIGVLSAIEIAHEGKSVAICERGVPISQASALNAGGVRRIGRAREEMPLAMAAGEIWRKTNNNTIGNAFVQSGHLILAETEAEAEKLTDYERRTHEAGLAGARLISAVDIAGQVPDLHTGSIVLGMYSKHDGYAEPGLVKASVLRAANEAGLTFHNETNILEISASENGCSIQTDRGEIKCRQIVNAAGYGGANIATMVGDIFEIDNRAPIALETTASNKALGPVIQTVGRKLTLKQLKNGRFLIGGGHWGIPHPKERCADAVDGEVAQNIATARSLLGVLDEVSVARSWAGLEAYSTDGLPIVGRSASNSRVIHAFAFSGHGFQIAPAVAQVVADLIAGRTPRTDISGLRADRFLDPTSGADRTF